MYGNVCNKINVRNIIDDDYLFPNRSTVVVQKKLIAKELKTDLEDKRKECAPLGKGP